MVNGQWAMVNSSPACNLAIVIGNREPSIVRRVQFTIDHSPLTIRDSPLTIHDSPLTIHDSPLTIHDSPLTIDHSRF
jgi:hypothetical protein